MILYCILDNELKGAIVIPPVPAQSKGDAGKGSLGLHWTLGIEPDGEDRFRVRVGVLNEHHFAMIFSHHFR